VVLPLRVITPIVGGGVEAMEPDAVDIVRLPEIRGILRWWWRALYAGEAEEPDALFRREAALWGGVDVPSRPQKTSYRSRVRLHSRILSPGRVAPAGTHQPGRDGKPRAFPTWTLGKGLGYALFALQRTTDERRKFRGQAMPTRAVRTGVRFELAVAAVAPSPAEKETERDEQERLHERWPEDIRQVLQTLWAWIHLGGLGARSRRGFGALALDGEPEIQEPEIEEPGRPARAGPATRAGRRPISCAVSTRGEPRAAGSPKRNRACHGPPSGCP
jgi:CRISPR-associated protein Cmr1